LKLQETKNFKKIIHIWEKKVIISFWIPWKGKQSHIYIKFLKCNIQATVKIKSFLMIKILIHEDKDVSYIE
jgi:hypothetical protein